nr:MAG TPA: hypothetical protein [Caudoviricetes sp.]
MLRQLSSLSDITFYLDHCFHLLVRSYKLL